MRSTGVETIYYADFGVKECGHAHKTFNSAVACAKKAMALAKRGGKFYGADDLRRAIANGITAEMLVHARQRSY